jgi:hypothetical protein
MESGEANRFFMTGKSLSSALELSLVVEGTTVGTSYKDTLDEEMDPSGSLQVQDALGMRTLLAILRLYGVSAAFSREPTRFEMTLLIPFRYNPLS